MCRSILCAALLLAACGSAPTNTAVPAPTPQPPSAFQKRIAAMNDQERNVVFIRAIRDSGHDCQGVTASQRKSDQPDGGMVYAALCNDGANYGVVLDRDGTAQVLAAGR